MPSRSATGEVEPDPVALASATERVVELALAEDLGADGDVTSAATVADDLRGEAELVARADGVVAGMDAVAAVYRALGGEVALRVRAADGDRVAAGDVVAELAGPVRALLTGERTACNLITHLSGVATATAELVAAVAHTDAAIRDTRKTTPGLRLLEKAAVRAGGGVSHRVGLYDALLVKDNHVAAAGSVAAATRAALAGAGGRHVQVEVDDLDGLDEALAAGARDVLLDNFDVADTREAVARVRARRDELGEVLLESSGGLTRETLVAYAEAGVDRIAVGAITHSAPQLDLALDLRIDREAR